MHFAPVLSKQGARNFKSTCFFVDCFYWNGHVGCSAGYNLDEYSGMNIKSINSQVNKQTNTGMQRIKGQLSYMNLDNFLFISCHEELGCSKKTTPITNSTPKLFVRPMIL